MSTPERPAAPKRQLTLFDSTSIIVGIIIGASIYEASPLIAQNTSGAGWLVAAWLLGGVLSLIGALCYAELTTAYPKQGGDYVYLTRAFGRSPGFLFAWAQLWVIRPGSIGAMAYVFARYANRLWPVGDDVSALMVYAAASVLVLTGINMLSVREGKWTQNVLTVVKVVGLVAVCGVGLWFASPDAAAVPPVAKVAAKVVAKEGAGDFRLAMILILYAYGGWNEMAYVGAEVRDPNKNILRTLLLGTVAVTLIYVLVALAFLHALGFQGFRQSQAVAADVLQLGLGDWAARAISVLICVSALGAINGQIFTGARIYYAMGAEHRLYRWLGHWSRRRGTPIWSLLVQAVITLALIVGFGLTKSGFQGMVEFTTPIFWFFFLLAGMSLFALRRREPNVPRPYRVPWYPLTPILFCLSSLFMLYSSLSYAVEKGSHEPLWAVAIMFVGVVLSFFDPQR